jgi:hypothetical protein
VKISSKRNRFDIHMLNSEVGWIKDGPFILVCWMDQGFYRKRSIDTNFLSPDPFSLGRLCSSLSPSLRAASLSQSCSALQ